MIRNPFHGTEMYVCIGCLPPNIFICPFSAPVLCLLESAGIYSAMEISFPVGMSPIRLSITCLPISGTRPEEAIFQMRRRKL